MEIPTWGASSIVFSHGWPVQVDLKICRSERSHVESKLENVTVVYRVARMGHPGISKSTANAKEAPGSSTVAATRATEPNSRKLS